MSILKQLLKEIFEEAKIDSPEAFISLVKGLSTKYTDLQKLLDAIGQPLWNAGGSKYVFKSGDYIYKIAKFSQGVSNLDVKLAGRTITEKEFNEIIKVFKSPHENLATIFNIERLDNNFVIIVSEFVPNNWKFIEDQVSKEILKKANSSSLGILINNYIKCLNNYLSKEDCQYVMSKVNIISTEDDFAKNVFHELKLVNEHLRKLSILPTDLHSGNVGMSSDLKIKVFDW